MKIVVAEETWRRAVISPPFYISYVRLPSLSFGKIMLLESLGMSDVITIEQFTHALYLVKQKNFKDARDAVETWHKRLLLNPKRLWVWFKRVMFQYTFHILNLRKNEKYYKLWKQYIDINTSFPDTEFGEDNLEDDLGLGSYGVIRAVLINRGVYNAENILDTNILQVLHDYSFIKGIRLQTAEDVLQYKMMEEDLRNAKSDK